MKCCQTLRDYEASLGKCPETFCLQNRPLPRRMLHVSQIPTACVCGSCHFFISFVICVTIAISMQFGPGNNGNCGSDDLHGIKVAGKY